MMEFDSRESTCLISIVPLPSCRPLSACFFMRYLMRRRFQRWRLLAMIQQSTALLTRQIRRRETRARARRSVWSLPRPQLWFERLLNDRSLDGWWKENFRVSRAPFEYICRLVGPALSRQDTAMRAAVAVDKRVSTSLWQLATGDCYRTYGLMMEVSKSTAIQCCHEFLHELNSLQGDFIKFPITRQDYLKKIEGFSQISKIPNLVAANDGTHI